MTRIVDGGIAVAAIVFASALLAATSAFASSASFDCAKATRQIDKAICAWDTVGSLDGKMASAYRAALAVQADESGRTLVAQDQQRWLAARDQRCALDAVKPDPGSEEGLSPQEFGQLLCLQDMYGSQIAHLEDMVPPLVPISVSKLPTEPLRAAYPDDAPPDGYQAQFSPDKALMALGVEDSAGYVKQVWLYQPASGRLVAASPRTHKGAAEKAEDISGLNSWVWGDDGRFYVRVDRPLGDDGMFGADMEGYAEANPPADVAEDVAASIAASQTVPYNSEISEEERPPGFDDDSYDEQKGGAFSAWAQNKGHGSFELMVARSGDKEPRIVASGGWELRDFLFDPSGTRLFYNGEDGLVVTDPESGITRHLQGTRGAPSEVRPINLSADGEILVYSASGSCSRDEGEAIDHQDTGEDDGAKRVCLAYLPPIGEPHAQPLADRVASKPDVSRGDPWVGEWSGSGEGNLSATIRRGTAKPSFLVIDLYTDAEGCSGAVTLYGEPKGATVLAESYDSNEPAAPVCRMELSLERGVLETEVAGPCTYYHGGRCGFDGSLTRSK